MLDRKNMLALMKATAKANNVATSYSYEGQSMTGAQLNEALRKEMFEMAGTPQLYRENKNVLFSLLEETISEVLPNRVADIYKDFAETKIVAQGDSVIFTRKLDSTKRAKQFITRVGLAGRYEAFKLGAQEKITIKMSAIGGAAQLGIEEFLDGRVDYAELLNVIIEGIEDVIQKETGAALKAGMDQLPAINKVSAAQFDAAKFDNLLAIADSYGKATIYCDFRFAATIMPDNVQMMSDSMKNELWERGYFLSYKNHNVVILPNSVEDDTNGKLVYDPSVAFIVPTGVNKPVYIALEGATQVRDIQTDDWGTEIQCYKKVGVGVLMNNGICTYTNTALKQTISND